jgi:hypothetical protein
LAACSSVGARMSARYTRDDARAESFAAKVLVTLLFAV